MNPPPLKILAVDNEQLLLWALKRAGRGRALEIDTAATTEQALAEIKRSHFDLFLLAVDLKDQNSQLLLQTIDDCCPYVPIIVMTTSDVKSCRLNDAIKAVRKHGAWHMLEKPFSLDRLITYIDVIFQDQARARLCVDELTHNYESEKRQKLRRPHVQSVAFSFTSIIDGEQVKTFTSGIVTDISDCGLGILTRFPLEQDLVINFGESLMNQCGVVAWRNILEEQTCRTGIRLC